MALEKVHPGVTHFGLGETDAREPRYALLCKKCTNSALMQKRVKIHLGTPKVGTWISAATYPILAKLVHNRANIVKFFLSMHFFLEIIVSEVSVILERRKTAFMAPFGPNESW